MSDPGGERQDPREWTIRICPICRGNGVQLAHGQCVNECRRPDGIIPPMVPITVREVLSPPPGREGEGYALAPARGQRLYAVLGLFDTRDGSKLADLVRAAREGWERSDPEMDEPDAWAEFEARRARLGKPGEPLASPSTKHPGRAALPEEDKG